MEAVITIATLIPLVLKVSIVSLVFGFGLRTKWSDVSHLANRPKQLARSLLSMNIAMPVAAGAICLALSLQRPVSSMLLALSLCPTPPLLPSKAIKAGGGGSYAASLLVAAAIFSILSAPVAVELMERVFGTPLEMSPLAIATVLVPMMLAPLLVGMVLRPVLGAFAEDASKWLSLLATVALLSALALVYAANWRGMADLIGNGTILALSLFCFAGMAIGHMLGGPEPGDRTVLALATSSRHPGLAIAICLMNFPTEKGVLPVALIYSIVSAVTWIPYVIWRKRQGAAPAGATKLSKEIAPVVGE
jgi:BASS family bile acid:Na+ symporter